MKSFRDKLKASLFTSAKDLFLLTIPVSLFYYEFIFSMSTTGLRSPAYLLYYFGFSAFLGVVLTALIAFIRKPLIQRIVKAVLLFAFAFLFSVIFLSYTEYQMFYDLNTMLAGAGGIWHYMHEVRMIVFNGSGIFWIIAFFVPFIAYLVAGLILKKDPAEASNVKQYILFGTILVTLVLVLLVTLAVRKEDKHIYMEQFSFSEGVPRFGLIRGLQLELTRGSMKQAEEELAFSGITAPVEEPKELQVIEVPLHIIGPDETVSGNDMVEKPKTLGYNKLDIDFDALKEGASPELLALDQYVQSLQPSKQNEYTGLFEGKNLIIISAEALSKEAINEEFTPTLYRMATKGIVFEDFYQPAICGTTGGEFHNLFGMMSVNGGTSLKMTADHFNYMTMGTQLTLLGYSGGTYHNGTPTFYDRNITHINLGYPDGFMALGNGMEKLVDPNAPYSDISMMKGVLPTYLDRQPFNLYFMSSSGHSPYNQNNSFGRRNYSKVENLDCSEAIKCYFSTQIEFDLAMEATLQMLEEKGILNDTVIVICSDHFPYGLDDSSTGGGENLMELYGQDNISDLFVRDHNALIIWSGCLEEMDPIVVSDPVESMDILPTLLNLFGIAYDSRLLPGRDVFSDAEPLVYMPTYAWKTDKGIYQNGTFTPNEGVTVDEEYINRMKAMVSDKITYSKGVLNYDYYRHVFPEAYEEWTILTTGETKTTEAVDQTETTEQSTEPATETAPEATVSEETISETEQ